MFNQVICISFVCTTVMITAIAKQPLIHFVLSMTISSFHRRGNAVRLTAEGYPPRVASVSVCLHKWLSTEGTHALSWTARCCEVKVNPFSTWLLLLEVCHLQKLQELILPTKESCVYNGTFGHLSRFQNVYFFVICHFFVIFFTSTVKKQNTKSC